MKLFLKRLEHGKELDLPTYQSEDAAGIDLYAACPGALAIDKGGGRKVIPTGISIALPKGYEAQVRPRSGLAAKYGITVLNTPGTVDSDYRGEIMIILCNTDPEKVYYVHRGDRIAQLVVAPVVQASIEEVEELDETERGEGGLGSTGE